MRTRRRWRRRRKPSCRFLLTWMRWCWRVSRRIGRSARKPSVNCYGAWMRSPSIVIGPMHAPMTGGRHTCRAGPLLRRLDRLDLDRLGLRVERADDGDLLAREFLRQLLIAEHVFALAVVEHVRGSVQRDARLRALSVVRAHLHFRMIALRAHVVGDDAGERLVRGCSRQRGHEENTEDKSHGDLNSQLPTPNSQKGTENLGTWALGVGS